MIKIQKFHFVEKIWEIKKHHIRQGIKNPGRELYTTFLDLQPKVRPKPRRSRGFVGVRGRSTRLLQNRGEAEVFAGRGGH